MNVIKSKVFELYDKGVKPCLLVVGSNVLREMREHHYMLMREPGVIIIGPCKLTVMEWYQDDNYCEVYGNEQSPFFTMGMLQSTSVEVPVNLQHRITWYIQGLWKSFKRDLNEIKKYHSPKGMFQ